VAVAPLCMKSEAAAVNTNSGLWRRCTYSSATLERPQIALIILHRWRAGQCRAAMDSMCYLYKSAHCCVWYSNYSRLT
jgi:hypothetical protein